MGPIVSRLFKAARPPKTIAQASEPYEQDAISRNPGEQDDEEGLVRTPMRRFGMRQRVPNPKREM